MRPRVGALPAPAEAGILQVEIKGHPSIVVPNATDDPIVLTVCALCGKLRTILWLSGDRWYCTSCRDEGDRRPKMIPIA